MPFSKKFSGNLPFFDTPLQTIMKLASENKVKTLNEVEKSTHKYYKRAQRFVSKYATIKNFEQVIRNNLAHFKTGTN